MIEHYLSASEQIDSRLAIGHRSAPRSAGVLLQRLPGATANDESTWRESLDALADADPLALGLAATSDVGLSALFPGQDLRVFRTVTPRFACSCSLNRVEGALRIAGRQEIETILAEQGRVEVTCEFCGKRYMFAPEDARALFAAPPGDAASTRH